ncbi:MAG: HTTM domain-containing protein [Saprospiraceae bacterium]
MLRTLRSILFRPVPIATLVWLRIAVGILGVCDVIGHFAYYHLWEHAYDADKFHFAYYGFEWVHPLPEPFMSLYFITLLGLGVSVVLGWRFRITAPLFALGYTGVFLLEKAHYLNHGYLFCWLLWILAVSPVWREWSHDVRARPGLRRTTVPYWNLFIFQAMMGIVYFFGGIAKLNADWMIDAMPLKIWLPAKAARPIIGPLLELEATAYFMSWGGAFLDLFVVPLLIWKRTRWLAFGMVVFFHLCNHLIFNIGIFPYLSLVLTSLYFRPDWPQRGINWLAGRWAWVSRWKDRRLERLAAAPAAPMWQADPRHARPILIGLGLLFALHIFLPLRNHFFDSDVAWSEEGHRYSWRMMLRTKAGYGHLKMVDRATQKEEIINTYDYLSNKQARKMATHPDMILSFAHYIAAREKEKGRDVAVYSNFKVRLNGRDGNFLIDPERDLTQIHWTWRTTKDWILPETEQGLKDGGSEGVRD